MIFDIPASADFRKLRVRGKDVNVLLNIVLTKMPEYFGSLSGGWGWGGAGNPRRHCFLFVFLNGGSTGA